jgi:hypothetical protein
MEAFQLGPSWARDGAPGLKIDKFKDFEEGPKDRKGGRRRDDHGGRGGRGRQQRDDRDRGQRRDGDRGQRDRRGGRGFQRGRGDRGRDGREQRRFEPIEPPPGLKVEVHPAAEAVELIAKEVHQYARVYSLFDIARVLLAQRDRYRLRFRSDREKGGSSLFKCRHDDSLWLTRDEALAHMWDSEWRSEYYQQETIEVDPPKGNFQHVARCGLCGELLGPPNYHGYQKALRALHRERFSNMSFERYASRVRTEQGEEVVAEWLETMKTHTRIRDIGSESDDWMTDRAEVERHFSEHHFDKAFEETDTADLPGDISGRLLSPQLLAAVKLASGHTRKHPAMVIPSVCRILERQHMPVFKRGGKLFAGPARPHPLAADTVLAERPAAIVEWLRARSDAKLADLWTDLLPDGQSEPCEKWLADLFWLLTQGNVLLMSDDRLLLPGHQARPAPKPAPATKAEEDEARPAKRKRSRRRRKRKRKPRPMIKVRKAVERMSARRLKKVRGVERIWRNRLRARVRRTMPDEEEESE